SAQTSYRYDGADRLTGLTTVAGASTVSSFASTLNRQGLRTAVTETLATGTPAGMAPGALASTNAGGHGLLALDDAPPANPPTAPTAATASRGGLPLAFVANAGQIDSRVRYLVRG